MLDIDKLSCSDLGCILSIKTPIVENIVYQFRGVNLKRKNEFHITIFTGTLLRSIKDNCSREQEYELYQFLNNFNYKFLLTDEVFFLKKDYGDHIRYSKIIKVKMKNKMEFEKEFSRIVGFSYSIFPHITTHSFSNIKEKENIGIGLQSEGDFKKYVLV